MSVPGWVGCVIAQCVCACLDINMSYAATTTKEKRNYVITCFNGPVFALCKEETETENVCMSVTCIPVTQG